MAEARGTGQGSWWGWLAVLLAVGLVGVGSYAAFTGRLAWPLASSASGVPRADSRAGAVTPLALWEAFQQAQAVARARAADAVLVSASAQWQAPPRSALVTGTADWAFVFYAPGEKAALDVVVDAQGARLVNTAPVWVAPQAVAEGEWLNKGPKDALLVFLAYGGEAFLAASPQAVVEIHLAQGEAGGPVWTVTALDVERRAYLAMTVDALRCTVLRHEKGGADA